jgi:SAM-dependent methyltransferase
MPCCSGFCAATQRQFDFRVAGRDLARYRRKGPHATARILRQIILSRKPMRGTLLDIGAGIGALTFELLNAGFGHATAVDASSAYVAAGREETVRRGLTHDVNWVEGDFVNLGSQLMPADVVTLDRVVCCYPAYEPLLETALDHARQMVGVSYPRDRWYVRAVIAIENAVRWLKGGAFRTFVHSPTGMAALFGTRGFRLVGRHTTLAWSIDLYATGKDPETQR